jgi:hypothetical protein
MFVTQAGLAVTRALPRITTEGWMHCTWSLTPDAVHGRQIPFLKGLIELALRIFHGCTAVVLAVAELVSQPSRYCVVLFTYCQGSASMSAIVRSCRALTCGS